MIATIIPYFLACNISADPAWPNGPEYVYHVKGNFSMHWSFDAPATVTAFNLAIRCRPKNAGTMSCVKKSFTASVDCITSSLLDNVTGLQRFEMEFNDKGVENITVPEDMNIVTRTFVELVASQFTVGADLSGKTDQDGIFQATNSTVEPFKMNIKIGYPPDTENNKASNLYQLEFLQDINHPVGRSVEITKDKLVPLDGVYRTIEIPSRSLGNNKMTTYHHIERMNDRMKISKDSLELFAHRKGTLRWIGVGLKIFYENFIETTLVDVIAADDPISAMENPTTFVMLE